jgi:hypothetical protein
MSLWADSLSRSTWIPALYPAATYGGMKILLYNIVEFIVRLELSFASGAFSEWIRVGRDGGGVFRDFGLLFL